MAKEVVVSGDNPCAGRGGLNDVLLDASVELDPPRKRKMAFDVTAPPPCTPRGVQHPYRNSL